MRSILHAIAPLPKPFGSVDQRILPIKPGGHVLVAAQPVFKALILFHGEARVCIDKVELGIMRPGDTLFVPRSLPYRYYPLDARQPSELHVLRIHWCTTLIQSTPDGPVIIKPRLPKHDVLRQLAGRYRDFTLVPLNRQPLMERWIGFMKEASRHSAPQQPELIHTLLQQWLLLCDYPEYTFTPAGSPGQSIDRAHYHVARARELLISQPHLDWSLASLAWELDLSGEHLARLFKRVTGTTLFAELRRIRMEKAKEWLITTDYPIATIAERVGIPELTVFGRLFKQLNGTSPSLFRQQERNEMIFVTPKPKQQTMPTTSMS